MMVNLPSLTEKDERDLRAGVEAGIDFVALSFVRKSDDILLLRDFLDHLGSRARIIAKIEDQSGVRNMHSIIKVTDAVMVARGDLGIEIDYHTLPLVQTQLVDLCLKEGKPVIIATHLLESMISAPMPTRAEISDISTAVRERGGMSVDAVATAIGEGFGLDPGSLDVQLFAGVVAGARLAAQSLVAREPGRDYVDTLDAVLERLEGGIPIADLPLPAGGRAKFRG
jgi:pyruvate kinase